MLQPSIRPVPGSVDPDPVPPWPVEPPQCDAAADVGHKAHVLLVQHGDGDVAALGKVEEPAGGGHHHVTALGPPREQGVRIRQGSPVCNRFSLC